MGAGQALRVYELGRPGKWPKSLGFVDDRLQRLDEVGQNEMSYGYLIVFISAAGMNLSFI